MKFFDLRSILLAKHAQHIVLIHFPIALCLAGVGFDFLAQFKKSRVLADVAYYNLVVAAFSTIPVVVTGLLAWHFQLDGQRLKGPLLMHLLLAIASTGMIWIVLALHRTGRRNPERQLTKYRIPVELVSLACITATAHLGGIVSGVIATS